MQNTQQFPLISATTCSYTLCTPQTSPGYIACMKSYQVSLQQGGLGMKLAGHVHFKLVQNLQRRMQ